MQPPVSPHQAGSPHPTPARRRNLHHPNRFDRAVPRRHNALQRRARHSTSSRKPSGIRTGLEVVHTFPAPPESPSCGGQGVPKHRSRDQKRSKVASRRPSPDMAGAVPTTNGVQGCEADVQTIQRPDATVQTVGIPPRLSQQRPISAHCAFQESRRWAESHAEWIDRGNRDVQHTSDRRRASEDLLQSKPLPATALASAIAPTSHHRRVPSNDGSLEQAHSLGCWSRSLSTDNWLNIRRDTAQRKIQVHHQLGRFVRKITDASNWAIKEPTESLNEPEEPNERDSLAQRALKAKPRKPSTRRVAKLSKKPRMDNIRAHKEVADKAQENGTETNADAIINLNAAEDTPKRSKKTLPLREQDIEEIKRKSADLREVLSEYQSDRHGNLLPEINTDAIGDLGVVDQRNYEQSAISEPAAESRDASEQLRDIESIEITAWKTSNPNSGRHVPNASLLPPQPGPRTSSRHVAVSSSTVRCVDGSRRADHSADSAPQDPFTTVAEALKLAAIRDQIVTAPAQERTSMDALSAFGAPPTRSTDTLTTITNEALGINRPLAPSHVTNANSVMANPSVRPAKLHSGFVSSGKAPGDAPNRPLPDLPEVPSPESSETSRREAGSRASSRSRRSLQRMSTQPGHNRRTPSVVSIASLDGVLQEISSPHGSPQRRSRAVKKVGSVRSSSGQRLSGLIDAARPGLATIEKSSKVRSPDLDQSHDLLALEPTQDARDTVSRDQRIHDKRLQDIASARARWGKRVTHEDHQSIPEDPAAEDFPSPPSSRPPSRATIERPRSDIKSHAPTANISAVYLPNSAGLQRPQTDYMSPTPDTYSLANRAQTWQTRIATNRSRGGIPLSPHSPIRVPTSISSVIESPNKRHVPQPKRSHASLRSNTSIVHSQTVHGTQTPPLSESSTPSSDEDGTGVMGTTTANKAKVQKRLHLSANDLAAMVTNMYTMREQLDAQMRKLQSQSKQIRVIEMQKLRMVDAVNALIAVVSEPGTTAVQASSRRQQVVLPGMNPNPMFGWRDRESVASTSNTIASAGSASSGSRSSDATFITEPDAFGSGAEYGAACGPEGMEFNMDFDRMQELIRLDRTRAGAGLDREGKAKAKAKGSRRRKSGGPVGYLRIDT